MATPAFQAAASGERISRAGGGTIGSGGPFMVQTWVDEGVRSSEKQEGGVAAPGNSGVVLCSRAYNCGHCSPGNPGHFPAWHVINIAHRDHLTQEDSLSGITLTACDCYPVELWDGVLCSLLLPSLSFFYLFFLFFFFLNSSIDSLEYYHSYSKLQFSESQLEKVPIQGLSLGIQ